MPERRPKRSPTRLACRSSGYGRSRARCWPSVPTGPQEAQRATLRQSGDSGPGKSLGDLVIGRLRTFGVDPADAEWDSRKRADGGWQVQLAFSSGSRPHLAEWIYDPHRKHVAPADDTAARLCLPDADLPEAASRMRARGTGNGHSHRQQARPPGRRGARTGPASGGAHPRARPSPPAAADAEAEPAQAVPVPRERPARKAAGGRSRRSSVPSWDEIMFGTSRPRD